MPEGIYNAKELRIFEELNKNLKSIDKTLKQGFDSIKTLNSKTNRNTLMSRLVEVMEDISTTIKKTLKPNA